MGVVCGVCGGGFALHCRGEGRRTCTKMGRRAVSFFVGGSDRAGERRHSPHHPQHARPRLPQHTHTHTFFPWDRVAAIRLSAVGPCPSPRGPRRASSSHAWGRRAWGQARPNGLLPEGTNAALILIPFPLALTPLFFSCPPPTGVVGLAFWVWLRSTPRQPPTASRVEEAAVAHHPAGSSSTRRT